MNGIGCLWMLQTPSGCSALGLKQAFPVNRPLVNDNVLIIHYPAENATTTVVDD